jgi:hypothetical protein
LALSSEGSNVLYPDAERLLGIYMYVYMLRRWALVRIDVSEEPIATTTTTTISVTKVGELGATLAVTSNGSTKLT